MPETEIAKPDAHMSYMEKREAEMNAGREKVQQNMAASKLAKEHANRLIRDADEHLKEDMERRERILDTAPVFDKREHDQSGAEVADQAQTELEAVIHLANRDEPIIDMRRSNRVERLEDETVHTKEAEQLTTDHVTAQAVNQPTVIAEQLGEETEGRPLNYTRGTFTDEELALAALPTPKEKHVPKTRKRAEAIARDKVPPVEKVVKEGAVVSDAAPERNEAVDIVRAAPDEALSIDGTPETDVRSTTAESAHQTKPDLPQRPAEPAKTDKK